MRFRELFEADHIAVKGDTLWDLSQKYGVSVADIAKASGIKNPNKIMVGQKITIPGVDAATASAPASAAAIKPKSIEAPTPAPVPSFRQPKADAAPVPLPRPRPDPNASKAPIPAPVPSFRQPKVNQPLPANQQSQNPANVTGAPVQPNTNAGQSGNTNPGSQNPANVNGAPIVDPVAAAKARADAAGKQAADLQARVDAGNASLAAKQKAADQAKFSAADKQSMDAYNASQAAKGTKNPLTGPGGMTGTSAATIQPPSVATRSVGSTTPTVDDDPNVDSPEELQAAQDDIYQDRLAQADAEEAERMNDISAYVNDPMGNADKTDMGPGSWDDKLQGFDLGQYGRNKLSAQDQTAKAAKPDNFDIGRYLRTIGN